MAFNKRGHFSPELQGLVRAPWRRGAGQWSSQGCKPKKMTKSPWKYKRCVYEWKILVFEKLALDFQANVAKPRTDLGDAILRRRNTSRY
jgi:hypothetical protein